MGGSFLSVSVRDLSTRNYFVLWLYFRNYVYFDVYHSQYFLPVFKSIAVNTVFASVEPLSTLSESDPISEALFFKIKKISRCLSRMITDKNGSALFIFLSVFSLCVCKHRIFSDLSG